MPGYVERQPSGWYETGKQRKVPMLSDIFWAGGFASEYRAMKKDIEDLLRRGA